MVSKNPLVLKIAEGAPGDELLKYLLTRQLAFTEEEYLESLVAVLADPRSQEQARQMLGLIPQPVKEQYVQKREAETGVIDYILQEALEAGYFNVLTLIIQNQAVPAEFILRIAARAQAAVLETLLENQIRLIAYPEIMERMETNPECNPFIRGRIKELRDFYLQPTAAEAIPEAEVIEELATVIAEEHKEDDPAGRGNDQAGSPDRAAAHQPHGHLRPRAPGPDRQQDRAPGVDQGLEQAGADGRPRQPQDGHGRGADPCPQPEPAGGDHRQDRQQPRVDEELHGASWPWWKTPRRRSTGPWASSSSCTTAT